jgi:hypothetical protein
MDPINWVIPLHDVPCDFAERVTHLRGSNDINIQHEQSGKYYLCSPKLNDIPQEHISSVADSLINTINNVIGNGQVTKGIPFGIRADGVKVTLVASGFVTSPIEFVGGVAAEAHNPMEHLSCLQRTEQLHVEVESYPQKLLHLARSLIDEGPDRFSIAVIVVHMACEIATAQSLVAAFETKRIRYIKDWIIDGMNGYSLANQKNRRLYTALTGDSIQDNIFWQKFKESAALRNEIIHEGVSATQEDAEASYKAGNDFVAHLSQCVEHSRH